MNPAHQRFAENLDRGWRGAMLMVRHLQFLGCEVLLPPMHRAPSLDKIREHSDDGDFSYRGRPSRPWLRAESKWLKRSFTDRKWPFADFIVDGVATFDAKRKAPDVYFVLSEDLRYFATLDVRSTRARWWQASRGEGAARKPYYLASLGDVRFRPLRLECYESGDMLYNEHRKAQPVEALISPAAGAPADARH
jgi:hypothetical protein